MAWISIKGENHGLNSQPGDVWRDESMIRVAQEEDGYKPSDLSNLLRVDDYILKCINCHAKQDLVMTAHRIDGYLVGWIFVCRNCFGEITGKQLILVGV